MSRTVTRGWLAGFVLLSVLSSSPAAEPSGSQPGVSEVKDLGEDYKALIALMPKVADALRPKDPQTADRVMAAYTKAMQARTEAEIDAVIQDLSTGHFFDAKERSQRISESFEALKDLLTQRDRRSPAELEKRIQQLEQMKKALEGLKTREEAIRDKATPEAQSETLSAELGKAMAGLDALIAAQKGMPAASQADPSAAGQKQDDLAKKAQELADKLKQDLGNSEAAKDQKLDEAIKEAGRQTDAASQEMQKAAQSLGAKPSSSPPSGQPPQPGQEGKTPPPGQQPPQGEQASKPDPAKARPHQDEAVKRLEKAKEELAEKKRRIDEQLAKGQIKEMKAEQDKVQKDTEQQAQEMSKPEAQVPNAAQAAQQASQSMSQASQSMSQSQASQAKQDAQAAIDNLKKALDDVQKQQDEAKQEQKKQELFKLADELKKVLDNQRGVHALTADLDKAPKPLGRPEQIKMAKAMADQRALAGDLSTMIEKLAKEDAEVFSWALKSAQEDMTTIAGRLDKGKTDAFTQQMQGDVESTLEKLVDALKDEAKKKDGPPSQSKGGGGGKKQPLVPPAAQLKFLKDLQAQVHDKTVVVDKDRYAGGDYEKLSPEARERVDRIAQEQGRVASITKEWADKLAKGQ